jgi:hypothetical protein
MKKAFIWSLLVQFAAYSVAYLAVVQFNAKEGAAVWFFHLYYPFTALFDKMGLLQSYTGVFYILFAAPLLGMFTYSLIIGAVFARLKGRKDRQPTPNGRGGI